MPFLRAKPFSRKVPSFHQCMHDYAESQAPGDLNPELTVSMRNHTAFRGRGAVMPNIYYCNGLANCRKCGSQISFLPRISCGSF